MLVTAYAQLGEAYLRASYFEQALDHLTTALKLNGSLFTQVEATKQYHSHILTLLGNCYMEAGNYKDALSLLEKSHKMNKQIMGEKDESNGQILMVVGQVCTRQGQFEKAIASIKQALDIITEAHGPQSE